MQEKLQKLFEAALNDSTDFIGKRPQPIYRSNQTASPPTEGERQQPPNPNRQFQITHTGFGT
jgi:hypothetical protein